MRKKLLSMLLATTMVVGVLTGCGSSTTSAPAETKTEDAAPAEEAASADGSVQVGIVLPTKDEPRWLQDQAQFEKILGDAGFTNQVLFSQGSSATEKTNVETLVSQGIDVLIICAQDGAAAETAKAEGVTVIAYDRLITGTDQLTIM